MPRSYFGGDESLVTDGFQDWFCSLSGTRNLAGNTIALRLESRFGFCMSTSPLPLFACSVSFRAIWKADRKKGPGQPGGSRPYLRATTESSYVEPMILTSMAPLPTLSPLRRPSRAYCSMRNCVHCWPLYQNPAHVMLSVIMFWRNRNELRNISDAA